MKLKSDNYDAEESISILKEIDSNTTSEKEKMLVIKNKVVTNDVNPK